MRVKAVETFIVFLMTFLAVFVVYNIIFIKEYRAAKKEKNKKKFIPKKEPVEVRLMKYYYKVDISKLKYSYVLRKIRM